MPHKMTPHPAKASVAEQSLQDFLNLLAHPPKPGAGIPEESSTLLKNLWFTWNRIHIGLQWILHQRCKKLRPRTQHLLEWCLVECYALAGLPPHDAVNLAVDHARHAWGAQEAGFINGVMRGILRDAPAPNGLATLLSKAPESIRLQLPEALYTRWLKAHGKDWTRTLAALLQEPAAVLARRRGSLAALPTPLEFEETAALFQVADETTPVQEFYFQDPSTMLAPALLDPLPGESLADLCAAPGGKAVAIAERMQGKGHLLAADCAPTRMQRLQENLAPFPFAECRVLDATTPALPPESLDGVLLDVPCSNTGVIRRRPDVRQNFSPTHLTDLVALQQKILNAAATLVRPGGRIVYSTCSIEDTENISQIQEFLATHPEFTLETQLQLYPTQNHDGAYAARLRRNGA
jgi:16S rRNA (cytosine967-C5)-methyltransferase